jgi:hypothetical protein
VEIKWTTVLQQLGYGVVSTEAKACWKNPIVNIRIANETNIPLPIFVDTDVAWTQGGIDFTGQLIRYLPGHENGGAANMWAEICFSEPLKQITDKEFLDPAKAAVNKKSNQQANKVTTFVTATVA